MIDNNSAIPANTSFITEKKWSTFEICLGKIAIIVRSLDPNKAHGQDKISIRMIKICASLILKPLAILFRTATRVVVFLNDGRKLTYYL